MYILEFDLIRDDSFKVFVILSGIISFLTILYIVNYVVFERNRNKIELNEDIIKEATNEVNKATEIQRKYKSNNATNDLENQNRNIEDDNRSNMKKLSLNNMNKKISGKSFNRSDAESKDTNINIFNFHININEQNSSSEMDSDDHQRKKTDIDLNHDVLNYSIEKADKLRKMTLNGVMSPARKRSNRTTNELGFDKDIKINDIFPRSRQKTKSILEFQKKKESIKLSLMEGMSYSAASKPTSPMKGAFKKFSIVDAVKRKISTMKVDDE